MGLETEFAFTLPKGFVDGDGKLHRSGTMRLATARDEIEPLRDPRIQGADDPYLTILVLSRVITSLGSLQMISTTHVEGLFAADLAFLQDLYGIINFGDPADVAALQASVLPAGPHALDDAPRPTEPSSSEADDDGGDAGAADDTATDTTHASSMRSRARIEEVPRSTAS